jgi:8-amino-7-oxononanoate synthase
LYASLLADLEMRGLFRDPSLDLQRRGLASGDRGILNASSNDYLGLASTVSRETCSEAPGAGASRLIHGGHPIHEKLETELADWVALPSALLFTSGFAANAGAIPALAGQGALIISDALNHASIVDGCRLSRARRVVVPHLDGDAVERALRGATEQTRWVVTESYFSMDADGPDLPALRALCDSYGAGLYVDEAHALGVYGAHGAGRCAAEGVRPDVLVGTLGKAVGVQGAFIACSETLRTWLWNKSRSFVYSTAPSPAMAATTLEHVSRARTADLAREALLAGAAELRSRLAAHGVAVLGDGPILPIVLGSEEQTLSAAERLLREHSILVQAIRPPTVPDGSARLRVTVSASMSDADRARLGGALCGLLGRTP